MKRKSLKVVAGLVLAAGLMLLVVAGGVALAKGGAKTPPPPAKETPEESSYFSKFKSVFIDWDDNAPSGSPKTQVAGVRGIGVEQALGNNGYDWKAVYYMEDFQVSMADEKQFLSDGKLGPYQGK